MEWSRRLRMGWEATQDLVMVNLLVNFEFTKGYDKWQRKGGDDDGAFSVKSLRYLISRWGNDHVNLFNRVRWILLKINCIVWHMIKNKIPTFQT